MATYFLIEVLQVKDEAAYMKYAKAAQEVIESHRGEYIIRSRDVAAVTGTEKPERIILIRFPDEQSLKACFDSPEYREMTPLRVQSVESRAYMIKQ